MQTLEPVRFPHGHVESAGVVGATVPMIAGIIASPSAGGAGLIVAIVFSAMVAASAGTARGQIQQRDAASAAAPGTLQARLEPSGFDPDGLKGLGSAPIVRTIIAMVLLVGVVGFFSAITGAWWLGLGAAPLGVRICIAYARLWRPTGLRPTQAHDSSHP
jgi:hypothetical protein